MLKEKICTEDPIHMYMYTAVYSLMLMLHMGQINQRSPLSNTLKTS